MDALYYGVILGLFLLGSVVIVVDAGSYTPPDIDSINLSFQTSYTAPDISSINVTFGQQAAANDTCTVTGSANAVVKCSDYCNFTGALDMNGNTLTFNESGTITFTEFPTNFSLFANEGTDSGCVIEVG